MPGARCARSLACSVENTRVSHHGHTGITRHSPRNGFNGFLRVLPGDRAFLPPSPADHSANLTPASGRQDHTTSPSASQARSSFAPLASTASRPAFVTIAKRPSVWDGTAGVLKLIWGNCEAEYFCETGWTGKSLICPSGHHPLSPSFSWRVSDWRRIMDCLVASAPRNGY